MSSTPAPSTSPTAPAPIAQPPPYVELHCASAFSFLRAGSGVEALVARAASLGMPALALADYMTLAGVVRFQTACAAHGIRGIVGVELAVSDPTFGDAAAPAHLVALAENTTGYAHLCQLLTDANLANPQAPVISFSALAAARDGLLLLTGGRQGTLARLVLAGRYANACDVARRYAETFGPERVWVELQHERLPDSTVLVQQLAKTAKTATLRCVATNGVRYATRDDYPLYDLLTCVRLGITVDQPHAERPRNAEAYLKDAGEMAALFASLPWGSTALVATGEIAARCDLSLLRAVCTAPRVPLPDGHTPTTHLRVLCEAGFAARFPTSAAPTASAATSATPPAENFNSRQKRQLPLPLCHLRLPQVPPSPVGEPAAPKVASISERSGRKAERGNRGLDPHPIFRQNRQLSSGIGRGMNAAEPNVPPQLPPPATLQRTLYRRQLDHELDVIARLELEEFFLCVHDIVSAARTMRIRCSGRGSAANSLVAYLLGITGVDPLEHGLLFERFLNPERRGMPDIDIDIQSDRREELIRYVERTYTERHAAMVANLITYRSRSALRDAAKALGYPLPLVNRMTRLLSHHASRAEIPAALAELTQLIAALAPDNIRARCLERLPLLLQLAPRLGGLPRHLSLHNGGMVLTREPLANLLAVRISANGVRALEVDKDDVERLGLIKFDLLGLRTLGAVEEALALIAETTGKPLAVDALPLDDAATFELVRAGQTLAVFQIESPGQWHLLAQTQPQTFDDLIVQTALFRPGPLQANMVHPYVARRQYHQQQRQTLPPAISSTPMPSSSSTLSSSSSLSSVPSVSSAVHSLPSSVPSVPSVVVPRFSSVPSVSSVVNPRPAQRDAVQTPWHGTPTDTFWTAHPVLGPVLRDTEGILLFQEQILEIAHQFAGLSYADADGFRRAMSHSRTPDEMEAMRARFVGGAAARGETEADATRVFDAISKFVGYGFCKSHAAEFARTIYQTAYLKAHYPAHYLAAFLSCQPAGFFPPHVVLEEAKLLGIPVLPVDVNRSEDRFTVERVGSPPHEKWAIRIGLRQVAQVGEDLARAILWERCPPAADATNTDAAAAGHPFTSLADFCARMRAAGAGLTWTAAEALVLSGAFTSLSCGLERRRQLWQLHELWSLVAPARPARPTGTARSAHRAAQPENDRLAQPAQLTQLAIAWEIGPGELGEVPPLPILSRDERAALDHRLLGLSAQPHPMRLLRRELRRSGVRAIAELADVEAGRVTQVAGWAISAQRPPTAKGMGFLVLEDETGRLPVALPPRLAAQMHRILRDARVVAVCGRVERVRWYRSLLALDLRAVG